MRARRGRSPTGAVALILAAVGLLAWTPAKAGGAEGWLAISTPVFRNISQNSGLSSATEPTTFRADGDGFMWVGTQSGLLRWDGYNFKRYLYDPKQPGALPDNYVVSLHTDPKGRLWVGTNIAGLALYDPTRDRFIRYGDPSGRIAGSIDAIVDDGAGGLWIGSDKGLSHLDPVSGKVVPVAQSDLSAEAVNGLFEDSSGLLWVATPQGLFRRTAQGGFVPINLPHRDPGPLETTSVFKDSQGRIWIGTQRHGAYMLSPGAAAPVPVKETEVGPSSLSSETVETVAEIAPGEIWLGTQGHGIVAIDQAMHTHRIVRDLSVSASLCDNTVLNLYRGPSGLIWVATNQAIDIYNPAEAGFVTVFGPSSRPNGLTDGDIQSIAVMPDGHIWLGLGVGGVDILSPSSRLVAHLAPDPRRPDTALPPAIPDAITSTVNGQVYLGTTSGLYRVDERTHHAAAVPLPTPGHQRVRTLLWRDGALWVGERGLTRIVLGPDGAPRGPEAHLERGLGSLQVTALEPGPDGAIWVGTHAGLNLVDARMRILQTVPTLSDGHGVSPGGITSLLTDRHGRLWVSSTGGGIDILMGHDSQGQWRFHHLGAEQHLPDPNVDKLLLAPDGFVWASTDDGLAKIDPQTLTIAPRQGRDGVYLTSYWNGSGAVTAQGDVLFGGVGGMTVVRPSAMPPWLYQPSIVVTSAERGGKPLLAETFDLRTAKAPLSIGPEANGFRFEFAALDYSAPSYNRYAYQLVGYDTHWIETDAGHRIAAYTNLWPGRYTLRLRGSNREGIWTPRTLDIPIIVLPHWYQTGWFYGLALLSAVLAIAAIVLWRTAGLRRQRRDLERVVADRTAELREQTELALAANQAKSAFLAMMSHELRTPMNGVLGMARAMKMSQLNPEQERQLDMIVRSGDSLMTILNDILDLSKIEAGKLELEIAPFDLIELGQSAYDLWNDAASRKGVALVYHVDPATPRWVEGDPTRVRQIVLNLVSNALKFTLEGEVRVEIGPVGERIQIRVSDTGIGIPPAQQSKLFQSFSQADATTTRRFGGTGLGLSICKQLAESMGGGIQLYSIEGEGSTFTVDLVLPPAEAPVSSAAANAGESECDPDQPEGPPLEGLSLLVVDDNPTNLAVAGALMGAFGARTITANDGVQALEQLGQADFDVVLMDLQMPRMNGAEALSHIRAGAAGPRDIPVIALTAGVMAGETERLLGLGFDDVQPKPIIPGDLLRSILTVLAARADQTAPEAAAQRG